MTSTRTPIRRKVGIDRLGRIFRYDAHERACRTKQKHSARIRERFLAAAEGRLPPWVAQSILDRLPVGLLPHITGVLRERP